MNNKIFFLLSFCVFGLGACSPLAFNLSIDVKQNSSDVDLKIFKRDIAIYAFSDVADSDSALVAEFAFGVAERMEADRGITASSIPVFSISTQEVNPSDVSLLAHAASFTDSDVLFLVDSLSVGDYRVERVIGVSYPFEGQDLPSANLFLPFNFKFSVFDVVSQKFLYSNPYSDSLKWTVFADTKVSDVKLISEANLVLKDSFKDLGQGLAAKFSPQWTAEDRVIIYYDNTRWLNALMLAENFQWEKAMDVWMKEVKSGNTKKSAYAAYNIAVACEMLEDYGLALKWLDYAASKHEFREIGRIRARCESLVRN